jgi:pimeloyl-ACP methyl ester carboxylesterase
VRALAPGTARSADPTVAAFQRLSRAGRNDPQALTSFLAAMRPVDATGLRRVDADVLLINGDQDAVGDGAELVSLLPRVRRHLVPGLDHFGTPGSPAVITAALDFLGAG